MLKFKEWLEINEDKKPTTISNRTAKEILNKAGYSHDKKRGIHDIWKHMSGKSYALPRHKELSPAISREVLAIGSQGI